MFNEYWKYEFDQGFFPDEYDEEVESYCDSRNRYKTTQRRIKDKRKYFDEPMWEDRSSLYD